MKIPQFAVDDPITGEIIEPPPMSRQPRIEPVPRIQEVVVVFVVVNKYLKIVPSRFVLHANDILSEDRKESQLNNCIIGIFGY